MHQSRRWRWSQRPFLKGAAAAALGVAAVASLAVESARAAPAAAHSSPVHYRPAKGRYGDPIPFFWKGDYHVFYLWSPGGPRGWWGTHWAHASSRNLVDWTDLPDAIRQGAADGPDGISIFTGSVVEHAGVFHIWYTGPSLNRPGVTTHLMHATSRDLVAWTKHPEHAFAADAARYSTRDFRDPFIFRSEAEGRWWMLITTRDAQTNRPVVGTAASEDLVVWRQAEPLRAEFKGTPECPDLFRIGEAVRVQVFVCGSIIECFVGDGHAFSCRAYDHASGGLGLEARGGGADPAGMAVRVAEPRGP